MAEFKRVSKKSEIPTGTGKTVEVNGNQVALFNLNGKFCAIEGTCPHRGGPLGEGDLAGTVVTCPWHAWQFDVTTGASLVNPEMKIKTYEVKIEGEDILVSV